MSSFNVKDGRYRDIRKTMQRGRSMIVSATIIIWILLSFHILFGLTILIPIGEAYVAGIVLLTGHCLMLGLEAILEAILCRDE